MRKFNKSVFISFTLIGLLFFISCGKMSDVERGKKFMSLGDYENAIKAFELAMWDKPDDAEIRYQLAEALEKSGERRSAYKQYLFSAKIGSKSISKRFTERAWEFYEQKDYDAKELAKLAIIAHKKNAQAQFIYGYYRIRRDDRISGLPFLRDAIDWSSDKKIVEPTFEAISKNKTMLTPAFIEMVTSTKDRFEEFGPVVFSPFKDEILWSRAKRDHRGRYQIKDIKLFSGSLRDTLKNEITTVGTSIAFPVCSSDSTFLYYSDGARIYQYNRKQNTTARLMNGSFPDVSVDGNRLVFSRKWTIFISDSVDKNITALIKRKENEYYFLPRFVSPKDSAIVFLSYEYPELAFFISDTAGTSKKKIAKIDRYGFDYDRPWLNAYDISPDGKKIVFSRDQQLYFLNIETGKEDTLNVYGAYPTFSPDGKKLTILTRAFSEIGEVATVDLEEVQKANELFDSGKLNRKKLLKLLKKATKGMEKEEFEVD